MTIRRAMFALGVLALGLSPSALGQSLTFSSRDSETPIDVTADGGIEWRQTQKIFVARGNAKAVQGDVSVAADELVAHYRESPTGATEVFRVDAVGNVKMASADETATGAAAIYDIDKAVLVVEGDPVVLKNAKGSMTARRALQYWSKELVAVAEGDAEAVDGQRRLRADKLTAYFKDRGAKDGAKDGAKTGNATTGSFGRAELVSVRGEGNVRLTTAKEILRGDRGEYSLETGVAKLEGGVKMTQGQNQLNGAFAVVDTKAGTSRLFGSAAEAGVPGPRDDARVKALLAPRPRKDPLAPAVPAGSGG